MNKEQLHIYSKKCMEATNKAVSAIFAQSQKDIGELKEQSQFDLFEILYRPTLNVLNYVCDNCKKVYQYTDDNIPIQVKRAWHRELVSEMRSLGLHRMTIKAN